MKRVPSFGAVWMVRPLPYCFLRRRWVLRMPMPVWADGLRVSKVAANSGVMPAPSSAMVI